MARLFRCFLTLPCSFVVALYARDTLVPFIAVLWCAWMTVLALSFKYVHTLWSWNYFTHAHPLTVVFTHACSALPVCREVVTRTRMIATAVTRMAAFFFVACFKAICCLLAFHRAEKLPQHSDNCLAVMKPTSAVRPLRVFTFSDVRTINRADVANRAAETLQHLGMVLRDGARYSPVGIRLGGAFFTVVQPCCPR